MKHQVLQWSLVGLWEEPLGEPPEIERRFWMELFGKPYETVAGFSGANRFEVTLPEGDVHPTVTVAPQRIEFRFGSREPLVQVYRKVMDRLEKEVAKDLVLRAVGLNHDHEWAELNERGVDWIGRRFVRDGLGGAPGADEAKGLKLQFQIKASDPSRTYQIRLEPRSGVERGLFFHVNDHRDLTEPTRPTAEAVDEFLAESIELVNGSVFAPLDLEAQDDGAESGSV